MFTRSCLRKFKKSLVGAPGFGPGTACAQGRRDSPCNRAPPEPKVEVVLQPAPGARASAAERVGQGLVGLTDQSLLLVLVAIAHARQRRP